MPSAFSAVIFLHNGRCSGKGTEMYKDIRKSLVECGVEQIELGGTVYELNTAEAVGRGGSCLVYHAVKKDAETSSRDRKVIIKEFYPFHKDSGNWRKENGQLDIPNTVAEIRQKREQFERSFERFTQLYNIGLDNNIVTAETIEQTGSALYMVMEYSSGITLKEYMETCSLYEFFKAMQNLAGVLGVLHRSGYIHMDVKPQNILCLAANPAWPDRREQTRLLDTDSFIFKANFPLEIAKNGLSGSPGYTAPEVAEIAEDPDDILLAEDFLNVGECADMYGFGVILYAYIFGEIPEVPYEINHAYENRLEEYLRKKYEDIPHKAVRYIRNILKNTLAKDPYTRHEQYAAMEDIGKEIEKLLPMINAGEVRVLETFSPNSDPVIGRDRQLAELECLLCSESKGGRVVCITGIGGIGKSALARHYAKKYIDVYDMITEVSADSAEKAITGIHILNWAADEKSNITVADQYKKKMANLSARFRMLIIVNDYDTSSDAGFGIWKELGNCDVILTSRHNWGSSGIPTVELHSEDLKEEYAKEIFLHYYLQDIKNPADREHLCMTVQKEEMQLNKLLSAVNYSPLGIKLVARYLAAVPGEEQGPQQGLKLLTEQLFSKSSAVKISENKDSSALLQANIYGHLEVLFQKALEKGQLSAQEQNALRYMTLIPSAYGVSTKRFQAWTGIESICLVNLSKSGWLEYHPNKKDVLTDEKIHGVFTMPLMIREFLQRGVYVPYRTEENVRYIEALTDKMRSTHDTNRALWEHGEMILRNFVEDHTKEYLCLLMETARAYKPWMGRDVYTEENADRYWQKCLELCRYHPEEPLLVCECRFRMADLYTAWGEFEKGLQQLNRAWAVLRPIPAERLLGDQLEKFVRLFYGICQRCQLKGILLDITLPLLQFWRMLLKVEAGWDIQIGGLLADNYQLLGYYKAAENVRNTTIERCCAAGNSYERKSTCRSLLRAQGKLYLEKDQPDKALQYLGRSMQIGQTIKEQDRGFISNALIYELIGDAYVLKEDYVRAAQYHQRAIGKGFANVMADVSLPMKLALDFENWKNKKDFAAIMANKYWDRVLWIARGACKEADIQNREDVLEAMRLWAQQYFDGDHILWGMQALEKRAELVRRVYGNSRETAEEYLLLAGMFKSYGLSRRSRAYKHLAGKCKHFKKKG